MEMTLQAQPQTMTIVLQKFTGGGTAVAIAYDGKVPEQGAQACRTTLAEIMEQYIHAGARQYFKEEALRYQPVPVLPYHDPRPRDDRFETSSGIAPDMPGFMGKPSDLPEEQRGLMQNAIDKLKGKNGGAHLSVVLVCMFMMKLAGSVLGA